MTDFEKPPVLLGEYVIKQYEEELVKLKNLLKYSNFLNFIEIEKMINKDLKKKHSVDLKRTDNFSYLLMINYYLVKVKHYTIKNMVVLIH